MGLLAWHSPQQRVLLVISGFKTQYREVMRHDAPVLKEQSNALYTSTSTVRLGWEK